MQAKNPLLRWLTDVPRPYTSVLFRALDQDDRVTLSVHYARDSMGSHPWSRGVDRGFESRLYQTRLGFDWSLVTAAARGRDEVFVIAGWNDPTMNLCALMRRLVGLPYWIYTDTPDVDWLPRSRWKSLLRETWLRLILGGAERVLGTGRTALRRLHELGAREEALDDLPYYIDLSLFDRVRNERRSDRRLIFGSAGQLVARKDLSTAVRALARLAGRGCGDWVYRVVGTGPEEASLRAEASALGIAGKVEFLGWLEGDELIDFYHSCDVFLHPCEFEPWGVVVMEAMASGAAVVCSDRTYVALDRVEPERSGLLHRTHDELDLESRLLWLIEDRDRIDRLGAEARREALRWPVSRGVDLIAAGFDRGRTSR